MFAVEIDQMSTVEALYLVTAADEYYSITIKSLCVMAALPREREALALEKRKTEGVDVGDE